MFACVKSNSESNLYRSKDSGSTWLSLASKFPYPVKPVDFAVCGSRLVVVTDSNVFRSDDRGDTWQQGGSGFPVKTSINSMSSYTGSPILGSNVSSLYCLTSEITTPGSNPYFFRYNIQSNTWTRTSSVYGSEISSLIVSDSKVFVSYRMNSHSFYESRVSEDGTDYFGPLIRLSNEYPYKFGAYQKTIMAVFSKGYLISTEENVNFNWTPGKTGGLPKEDFLNGFITAHHFWIVTNSGLYRLGYN